MPPSYLRLLSVQKLIFHNYMHHCFFVPFIHCIFVYLLYLFVPFSCLRLLSVLIFNCSVINFSQPYAPLFFCSFYPLHLCLSTLSFCCTSSAGVLHLPTKNSRNVICDIIRCKHPERFLEEK